jgi:hypothetical protein
MPVALLAVPLILALTPGLTGVAAAADRGTVTHYGSGTVTIPAGDTASSVIAVGGKVVIAGTVRNTVFGLGTDVTLTPTAVVGAAHTSGDTSLALIGGSLTKQGGAVVDGRTTTVSSSQAAAAWQAAVVAPISHTLRVLSLIIWVALTLLFVVLAVLLAALAPQQLHAVSNRMSRRPLPTFGWGLLGLVVIVPIVTVLLVVSIIGLLALIPWGLALFATFAIGVAAVAVLLGERILGWLGYRGQNLVLAALVGVLVVRLVELIPYVGTAVAGLVAIFGFGAAFMAFWDWRRERARAVTAVTDAEQPEAAAIPQSERPAA